MLELDAEYSSFDIPYSWVDASVICCLTQYAAVMVSVNFSFG